MKCWVCTRQARGYGHTDNRYSIGSPRRYPIDWVFCSRRCQNAFHHLYADRLNAKEVVMIDSTDVEIGAMKQCLKAFGEAAGAIGFTKPLGDYSENEALQIIDAIVSCYTQAMVRHHEASSFAPVPALTENVADGFADLEDCRLWKGRP